MTDPLAGAEREMAVEASRARGRHAVAVARMRLADRDLAALTRVTWGGPVDAWLNARDVLQDTSQAVEAFEAFGG
jgi:hypothetical protein